MMDRALALYRSTIGKKVLMAISGAVLFGYLVGHMLGNLQVFLGRDVINAYGASLHSSLVLLWGVRIVLLLSIAVHIAMTVQLVKRNAEARPKGYQLQKFTVASYASRTMKFSGPVILVFILFHIAHLTLGWKVVPAAFVQGDVYGNLVGGFQTAWVSIFYVVAVSLVGLHLLHGAWSMFRTVGVAHPRYDAIVRKFAKTATIAVTVGFIAVPIAILVGIVSHESDGVKQVRGAAPTVPVTAVGEPASLHELSR